MTSTACNKIIEGLREALAIARGEAEPARETRHLTLDEQRVANAALRKSVRIIDGGKQ